MVKASWPRPADGQERFFVENRMALQGDIQGTSGEAMDIVGPGGTSRVASLAGQSWKRKRTRGKGKVGHARDLEEH